MADGAEETELTEKTTSGITNCMGIIDTYGEKLGLCQRQNH